MIYLVSLHKAGASRVRGFPRFIVLGKTTGQAAERAWAQAAWICETSSREMTGGPIRYDVEGWGEIVIQPLAALPAEKIKSLLPLIERDWGT